jgi:hypothetical protein
MLGTAIGIVLLFIVLGVLFWAFQQLLALVQPYIAEPFNTLIRIALVVVFVFIVIWAIIQLLSMAGISVPMLGRLTWPTM